MQYINARTVDGYHDIAICQHSSAPTPTMLLANVNVYHSPIQVLLILQQFCSIKLLNWNFPYRSNWNSGTENKRG